MEEQVLLKLRKISATFDESPSTTRRRAKRLGIPIVEGKVRAADFERMCDEANQQFLAFQLNNANIAPPKENH
jgi:hypothetical protein